MNAHMNIDSKSENNNNTNNNKKSSNNMNEPRIPVVVNTDSILDDIKEESNIKEEEEVENSDIDNNNSLINVSIKEEDYSNDEEDDNKTVERSTMMVLSSVSSETSSDHSVIIHHHSHNQNGTDNNNNNDNNNDEDISAIKDTKDGEVSIPLSTSSIAVDKFVSNEELVLLPPLPNEIDLQLETQNLTGSLTNSSNNENNDYITATNNNMTTTMVTDSFTRGSLLDPSSLTSNSTPDNELKSMMLLPQDTDMSNNTNNTGNHIENVSELRVTHAMMNISQGSPLMLTPLSEDGKISPSEFNNGLNSSFDLSKAFEMPSSSTPTADTENNISIVSTIPEHRRLDSNSSATISHKSSSILTKRLSNKSVTPIENKDPIRILRNEEKIYKMSNINQQENNKNKCQQQHELSVDLSTEVHIPYVSDALSSDEPDLTPLTTHSIIPPKNKIYNLNNDTNLDLMDISSQTTSNKKLPFLRRASSTLLRKASMKSLSRQDSNLVSTPRSSGTTPILASPSQFGSDVVRTRSNSVLQETTSRRKPAMKRNVSFGSRMKRSFSRIVSNGMSNNVENTNTPTSSDSEKYSILHSVTNDIITPTKPDRQFPLYTTLTSQQQQSSSNIQSPLDIIRRTHSFTPTSSSMSVTQPRGSLSSIPGISTPLGLNGNSATKQKQHQGTSKYIEINMTLLKDTKFVPPTNITDQIVNDAKTLDRILQQSKLSLLPSSYGSNSSSTTPQNLTHSLASSNSTKQDIKLEKLSIKKYVYLLTSLKDEEIQQYDAIIKNLEGHGWYSKQEIDNMVRKKDLLNKLWKDRISFYQNQL